MLSATAAAQPAANPSAEPAPAPAEPAAPEAAAPAPEAAAPEAAPEGAAGAIQDSDTAAAAAAGEADLEVGDAPAATGGLDEVVVTVDRRAKNLQKYSGTAAAFSEAQLSTVGITNVREMSSMVPGLAIGVQEGNTEVYIRGVGSDNNTELGDEAVAIHLDGVYLPRPRGVGSMFFDVERVEVNSGPQGTLRGRNAVGGSVNIVSNKPKLQEFGANAEATFGTFAQRRYQGMVNIPIGDTLAIRLAGFSEVHDPYYENAGPVYDIPAAENADSYALRAQLKWQPVKQFTALAAYDYTAERGTGYLGSNMQTPLTLEETNAAEDAANAAAAMAAGTMAPDPDDNDIATPYDISKLDNPRRIYQRGMNPTVNMRHQGGRLELTYDAGPLLVTATGSYRYLQYDQYGTGNAGVVYPGFDFAGTNPDNFSGNEWHTTSKSTIAELRFYAPDDARFRWALGGFYFNESQYAFLGQVNDPANGFGGGEFNMPDVKGGSIAAYADGTFDVTEDWRVLGGVRVTHETKSRKNGLWALWSGFGNGGRFGTEGFKYAQEDRTIFTLSPTSTVTDRVNAFMDGIKSFGARDTVPQLLCADPPAAGPGETQQPRVIPNGSGGMKCNIGINPNLLQQEQDFNAGVMGSSKPFDINMIPQNDEIKGATFFDWRVGTEYDLAKDNMLYATVTTGHKAGGFNDTIRGPDGQPQNPPQYTPEEVISFEVGTKNMLADRHIRLNASAFWYKYKDQVFQTIVTVTPDNPDEPGDQSSSIAVRQNAATSNVLGLDLDFTYSLPLGLEAGIHALLMDARFGDNTIVNDSRIGFDVTQYKVDIGGNQLPRAAPLTINYSLSQFLPTEAGIFHWLVSAQTVSTHYMSVYNGDGKLLPAVPGTDPAYMNTRSFKDLNRPNGSARLTDEIPTYTRFDIGGGWKHPDGRLAIEGFVNNVGNIAYATSIISTPGLNLRFFNPPRTAGVRVRVDW
ncbi:MAG TPA: TonB-dependent receptor [Polyangiaceae bacterium]|nr:TonB-dependent receptor [Polyangiaceae bacterium]